MRVTHIVPAIFGSAGTTGGAERYAFELAREMSRRVPTRLVSFGAVPQQWRVDDLRIRVLPRTHYIRGSRFNPISSALACEVLGADVVHCHQKNILASSLSAILARLSRRTVVVTDHGGGGFDFSWYISTDRLFHRHLHVSLFSRSSAGQDADPTATVVLAGVDHQRFSPPTAPTGRHRALFVGRILAHKGVHDLIDGLPPGLGLDIVGPEPDAEYGRTLRALAVNRDVSFLGEVAEADLIALYQGALCVVLPSTYTNRYGADTSVPELLGQTLLEGQACGAPVIATNVGGMPETLVQGVTGYVVPAGNPAALRARLEHLAANRALVDEFGRAGTRHVRSVFAWERVVERCFDGYGRR